MDPQYYGLITIILSTANILMPLMAFGVHNTIVKFYSSFKTRHSQNGFLSLMLLLPIAIIVPLALLCFLNIESVSDFLAKENKIVKLYTWYIFISGIVFAYFFVVRSMNIWALK